VGKKVVLFLGRLHPKKGLPILLEAWRQVQLAGCGTEWILAIAGWDQGGHEAELKAYVQQEGLADSVRFLGPLFDSEKHAALANADGFVLPSYSEGLPMAVLEAWAYGLPVMMTYRCNIPEGIAAGAALSFMPEPASIEQGLRNFFLMSAAERLAMGQRGRKLVEERFTWDSVAMEMFSVHNWILGGGQPPPCVIMERTK
jgi:poly(glycerol-phosphate) alpha-glucosyltransferase